MDRLEGELGAVDAWMECAMTHKKAEEIAARQFESLHGLHSLRRFADVIEVECVNHQQA
jgi:hypothetical protein